MNILIIHNRYKIRGGEDSVVENEAMLLERAGHKVYLYERNNSELDRFSLAGKLMLPFTAVFSLKSYKDVSRFIKEHSIDILHVHNTLTLISPSVYYAAFALKKPVVQTVHNYRFVCPGALLYRNGNICEDCIGKGLKCSVQNKCYRGSFLQTVVSAAILVVHRFLGTYKKLNYIFLTEFSRKILLSYGNKPGINESQTYIKPNFCFPATDYKGVYSGKIQDSISGRTRKGYVYVGRLDKTKGIYDIIKAFKELEDLELTIIGNGEEENTIKAYIQINCMENISMDTHADHSGVLKAIYDARALIFASTWYETFGMTIIESYSVGTPVIAAGLGNVKNMVRDRVTGFCFEPGSPKALEERIKEIESISKQEHDELARNAYREWERLYAPNSNVEILEDIYRSVLATE